MDLLGENSSPWTLCLPPAVKTKTRGKSRIFFTKSTLHIVLASGGSTNQKSDSILQKHRPGHCAVLASGGSNNPEQILLQLSIYFAESGTLQKLGR